MPHQDAGIRMEPPWSPPIAMSTSPAATSAPLPLDEPPAAYPRLSGLCTGIGSDVWLPPEKHRLSQTALDRKSTRLNSSHRCISYAVFCLKKKKNTQHN